MIFIGLWGRATSLMTSMALALPCAGFADEDPLDASGSNDSRGVAIHLTQSDIDKLPSSSAGAVGLVGGSGQVTYEYDSSLACADAIRGTDRGSVACTEATSACPDPAAPGPLRRIWRQDRVDGQIVVAWRVIAVTCAAGGVPGARPGVTLAMVREAFHRTPWATLSTSIQPVGGITLVNLDTYYAAGWADAGFAPGEVDSLDPASMLGYRVEIRPRLVGYTYSFGDGSSFGPTPNPGGPWPAGTIRHQYTSTGDVAVSVSATVGADFRIDGGAWAPISDTVTLTATPVTLTVKQARAVLINP